MKNMTKIPINTDFTVVFKLTDLLGYDVNLQNFTMNFYTSNVRGFIPHSYECLNGNCDPGLWMNQNTVKISFNSNRFISGFLYLDLYYSLPDATYIDGMCTKKITRPLNIEIIDQGNDASLPAIPNPEVITLDYVIKGYYEPDNMTEMLIAGEKFLGTNLVTKKPIYTQTFIKEIKDNADVEFFSGISGIQQLLEISGGVATSTEYREVKQAFDYFIRYGSYSGSLRLVSKYNELKGHTLIANIKYTKIID